MLDFEKSIRRDVKGSGNELILSTVPKLAWTN
jgi:hypothetical protein